MIDTLTPDCGVAADGRALVCGDLVMGLRWDPHAGGAQARPPARQADLDAFCVLFDAQGQLIEIVHPGHTRNRNGSVVHTGDSTAGTSEWDDERIFVFLDALPAEIATLAFVVRSATARVFRDIPGAACHLSDAATECVYLELDLHTYGYSTARCMAALHRRPEGWCIADRAEAGAMAVAAESLALGTVDKA